MDLATRALTVLLALSACRRAPRPSPPTTDVPPVAVDVPPPPRPLDVPPPPSAPSMYRLDPRRTGRSGWRLPLDPVVLRRLPAGGRVTTQPVALSDGTIVTTSHDGVVRAYTRAGELRWQSATGDRIYSTPLVGDDGALYVGTDADRFVALTARGHVRVALGTDDDADTSPVRAPDGALRFAAGHTLWSADADLTVRWRLDVGGKLFSSPAVGADGVTVIGSQDDHLYAVNADGTVRWSFATEGDVDCTPALGSDGTAWVGSDDGSVYAVDASGAQRWRARVGGYVRGGVALGLDGAVVVGTWGPRPRVVALDAATGEERWSVPVAGPPTRDYGVASAALVDARGDYAIGTPADEVLLIERGGGVRARVALPADVDSAPMLVDDALMAVGCDDGAVYLIGERTAGDAG
ncbi:MAG: PQQ-binding-like beta-propeller repeat protein [Polyangiales bacterium]